MYGCAGAKQGITIKVRGPWAGETTNSSTYLNCKSFFALKVQAMCDCNYKFSCRRPSAQGRPMTLTPSLYLDCLNTAEWALRRSRSMSRLYFADMERPLTGAILTNWSRLIAHGRSALRPCTRTLAHVEHAGCRARSRCFQPNRQMGLETASTGVHRAPKHVWLRSQSLSAT
jgi:hypothetical protein